jgi:hypothetical protein
MRLDDTCVSPAAAAVTPSRQLRYQPRATCCLSRGAWEAISHGSFVIQGSQGRVLETEDNMDGVRCLDRFRLSSSDGSVYIVRP